VPEVKEQIREMVRSEKLKQEVAAQGYETFEEADDFEVGDDFDPKSPYEENFEGIYTRQTPNPEPAAGQPPPAPSPADEVKG